MRHGLTALPNVPALQCTVAHGTDRFVVFYWECRAPPLHMTSRVLRGACTWLAQPCPWLHLLPRTA